MYSQNGPFLSPVAGKFCKNMRHFRKEFSRECNIDFRENTKTKIVVSTLMKGQHLWGDKGEPHRGGGGDIGRQPLLIMPIHNHCIQFRHASPYLLPDLCRSGADCAVLWKLYSSYRTQYVILLAMPLRSTPKHFFRHKYCYKYIDKKPNQIFLIYKEIQSGAVAKSYVRKNFL